MPPTPPVALRAARGEHASPAAATAPQWTDGPRLLLAMLWIALVTVLAGTAAHASPAATTTGPVPLAVLVDGVASLPVPPGVQVLCEEPGESLTPGQALSPALASRWVPHAGRTLSLGLQPHPVWLRFDVQRRSTAADWVLAIDWPPLERIDFHQIDPATGRPAVSLRAGLALPAASRAMHDAAYAFPLALAPDARAPVLLRVEARSALIVPLTLRDARSHQAVRYDHGVILGLVLGALVIMLLYNASLFAFTRDRSYGYYSAYLLSVVLYELAATGFGALYLWGDRPWFVANAYNVFSCLSFLSATLFCREFLQLGRSPVRHLRWSNDALVAYWAFATPMVLVAPSRPLLISITLVAGVAGLVAIYASVWLMRRGNVPARYFAIAWATLLAGTFGTLLALAGVVESNRVTVYGQHVGFVIEMVLLSLALADRIKRDRLQKEAAQQETFRLTLSVQAERDAKIAAQAEALALQQRANEDLELRVLDRTAELERAMKNLELANQQLARLNITDALTKLSNRRCFDEVLLREHDRAGRTGAPLALLLCDVDHFKRINDGCGHLAGDECLKLVASALAGTAARSTDLVARYGGEEFALVLPATSAEQAMEVAQRARQAVEAIQFISGGRRIPISISIGAVARVPTPEQTQSQDVASLIAAADAALYRAKDEGRNCIRLAA